MIAPDIIIVRHATAERSASSGRDMDRSLTALGMEEAMGIAEAIATMIPSGSLIISSPYARAMQTAGVIATRLTSSIVDDVRLGSDRPVEDFLDVIRPFTDRPLVIVGHMPTIAEAIATLIAAPAASMHIVPGTATGLAWHAPIRMLATLLWMMPPTIARH